MVRLLPRSWVWLGLMPVCPLWQLWVLVVVTTVLMCLRRLLHNRHQCLGRWQHALRLLRDGYYGYCGCDLYCCYYCH